MSARLLLNFLLIAFLVTGCATPLLTIEEPTEQERVAARQILSDTPLTDAALADTMDELVEQVDKINVKVVTATQRVCQLYKSSLSPLRCNAVWNVSPTIYTDDTVVNAFADEKDNVGLYTGLLFNMRLESERAAVLAHEYAHVMLGHVDKKGTNMMTGSLLGSLARVAYAATTGKALNPRAASALEKLGRNVGSRAYSPEMEMAADRMAVYILREAGYPVRGDARFPDPPTSAQSVAQHREGVNQPRGVSGRRIRATIAGLRRSFRAMHDAVTRVPLMKK